MPRQGGRSSGGSRAPSRPTVAPQRPSSVPQNRPATTAAYPPAQQHAPPAQGSQGPGLFGQMASTAAGVAVGSSIGHAIGGFFGGGSGTQTEQIQDNGAFTSQRQATQAQYGTAAGNCDFDAKQFTQCLDENKGNMQSCLFYLDQLKACQAAASQY